MSRKSVKRLCYANMRQTNELKRKERIRKIATCLRKTTESTLPARPLLKRGERVAPLLNLQIG